MFFKVDDLIILTEDGKDFYRLPRNELGPIYQVVRPVNTKIVYGYRLNDQTKFNYPISIIYYRIATESEVKTYKIKNLFIKKGAKNVF